MLKVKKRKRSFYQPKNWSPTYLPPHCLHLDNKKVSGMKGIKEFSYFVMFDIGWCSGSFNRITLRHYSWKMTGKIALDISNFLMFQISLFWSVWLQPSRALPTQYGSQSNFEGWGFVKTTLNKFHPKYRKINFWNLSMALTLNFIFELFFLCRSTCVSASSVKVSQIIGNLQKI